MSLHDSAFPLPIPNERSKGLTKREYMAAVILSGIAASDKLAFSKSEIAVLVDKALAMVDILMEKIKNE